MEIVLMLLGWVVGIAILYAVVYFAVRHALRADRRPRTTTAAPEVPRSKMWFERDDAGSRE